jgi:hypothetical protein
MTRLHFLIVSTIFVIFLCGHGTCSPSLSRIREQLSALNKQKLAASARVAQARDLLFRRQSELVLLASSGKDAGLLAAFRESAALGSSLSALVLDYGPDLIERSEFGGYYNDLSYLSLLHPCSTPYFSVPPPLNPLPSMWPRRNRYGRDTQVRHRHICLTCCSCGDSRPLSPTPSPQVYVGLNGGGRNV